MQVDFHYAVTYVVARYSGLSQSDAEVVAYCSAYVDDAVNSGIIEFTNGAMYDHIASAHRTIDVRNFEPIANRRSWAPFHFLPGNEGKGAEEHSRIPFQKRIICLPGSPVAEEMVRATLKDRESPYSLHRLGVTMHVYADTWAHQHFIGDINDHNNVSDLKDLGDNPADLSEKVRKHYKTPFWKVVGKKILMFFRNSESDVVNHVLSLGHGGALAFPDLPYLHWSYKNGEGIKIERKNWEIFLHAAEAMGRVLRAYAEKKSKPASGKLPAEAVKRIEELFRSLTEEDGEKRLNQWVEKIATGYFPQLGKERIRYIPKGNGSWKHAALNTEKAYDLLTDRFRYSDSFMDSHWKLFHDALIAHRFEIINRILPRYGICLS